eukprot:8746426-Pyramimonas_sp.AAC.1
MGRVGLGIACVFEQCWKSPILSSIGILAGEVRGILVVTQDRSRPTMRMPRAPHWHVEDRARQCFWTR